MKQFLIITMLFILYNSSVAQNKNDFHVEFSSSIHHYKMEQLNEFMKDTIVNLYTEYIGSLETKVKSGYGFNLSTYYQPLKFMDVGLFSSYQTSTITRNTFFLTYPNLFDQSIYLKHLGKYYQDIRSLSFGVSTNIYINKILKFDQFEKSILNRLQIATELNAGYCMSSYSESIVFPSVPIDFSPSEYTDSYYLASVNLKLGFAFLKRDLFSVIGLKFGYQFNQSGVITTSIGGKIRENEEDLKLDFSGFQYGVFLKFGK